MNFGALNANSSKMAKDMNLKFGRRAPRGSSDITSQSLTNVSEAWAWSGSHDPINFGVLSANSSKMAKAVNLKFGRRAPSDSPDNTPLKRFRKVGVASVT